MKFYNTDFKLASSYHRTLVDRYNRLEEMIPKRHTVGPVLVTTFGLDYNEYSGFFQNVVTMEDLFG